MSDSINVLSSTTNLKPVEEVFKTGGLPTHTFVTPLEYNDLIVALRTPGRGVVIEGPSGIGKTTAVTRALQQLGLEERVLKLSTRKREDLVLIRELPGMNSFGTVLIDDFHRLPADIRTEIADLLKVLADEETKDCKIVLIGINKAGESLVKVAHDLNNRLEIISLETNPDEKVAELLALGEAALNIGLNVKQEIVEAAHGSFYIAQMLAHQACLDSGILHEVTERIETKVSFEAVKSKVFERLSRTFLERTSQFARGPRFRREGRAPYLRLLHMLAQSQQWSLKIDQAVAANPFLSGSITQIVEKGYLTQHIESRPEISDVLHFDQTTRILSVEDPQFVYFLRNIAWSQFPQQVGFLAVEIDAQYDFALSFAGADRTFASRLAASLEELEFEVFYDKNEQHRILAADVEDYLRPIYQSGAAFVISLLGPEYPKRIWTKFESDAFRDRFKEGAVIPIWFLNAAPGMFDESTRVGGMTFDPAGDLAAQVVEISDVLRKKIADVRSIADSRGKSSFDAP